jgi:hypothetical protein
MRWLFCLKTILPTVLKRRQTSSNDRADYLISSLRSRKVPGELNGKGISSMTAILSPQCLLKEPLRQM